MLLEKPLRREMVITGLIFLLALALQLYFFAVTYTFQQVQGIGYSDAPWYYYAGKDLLKYHALVYDRTGEIFNGLLPAIPTPKLSPGYPCLAALFLGIFPADEAGVKALALINIAAFMGTLYYTRRLLQLFVQRWWIRDCVLLSMALYPGFIYNNSLIMTEYIFQMLLVMFIYHFWRSLQQPGRRQVILAALCFSFAIQIRGLLLPLLLPVAGLYYLKERRSFWQKISAFIWVWLICMFPWWLYTMYAFGWPMFLPAAGDDTMIYGMSPYLVDLFRVDGASMGLMMNHLVKVSFSDIWQLLQDNYAAAPGVFLRWRIFGMTQWTYAYIWSEFPRHPEGILQHLRFIHYLIVLPALLAIPIFYRRFQLAHKLLAAIPLYFFAIYMLFFSLPRYIWPALPFVFILFAIQMEIALGWGRCQHFSLSLPEHLCRAVYAVFSILLLYAILIFPPQMVRDISACHIAKAMGTDEPEQIAQSDLLVVEEFRPPEHMKLENVQEKNGWLTNTPETSGRVIVFGIRQAGGSQVLSKITIKMKTDSLWERVGVQFSPVDGIPIDEYLLPMNNLQSEQILYVNQDVQNFVISPSYFDGNRFQLESVKIEKFRKNTGQ